MEQTKSAILKRIKHWTQGKTAPPHTLDLPITDRCNLKCSYCAIRIGNRSQSPELTSDMLLKLIRDASKIGIEKVRIPGSGEPMIRGAETIRVMKEIKDSGLEGVMTTNATCFSEKTLESIVSMQWDHLDISLDSHILSIHERTRGKNTHARVLDSLTKIALLKRKLHSPKPVIALWAVLTKHNANSIAGLFSLAPQFDCFNVYLQPVIPYHWRGRWLMIRGKKLLLALERQLTLAEEACARFSIHNNIDSVVRHFNLRTPKIVMPTTEANDSIRTPDSPFLSLRCFLPWFQITVAPTGYVNPCSMLHYQEVRYQPDKLSDVWYGNYFEDLRQQMLRGIYPPECAKCCMGLIIDNNEMRSLLQQDAQI